MNRNPMRNPMKKPIVLAVLLCLAAVLAACAAPSEVPVPDPTASAVAAAPTPTPSATPIPTPEPQPFSILWIPDTQNMTVDGYAPVEAMVDWAAANKEAYNLRYAVHTGDIVNAGRANKSWERIAPTLRRLAETLPLMTAAGNHDVGLIDDYSYKHYIRWRFDTQLPESQLFEEGRGSYALLDTDAGEFLLVAMGAFPDKTSYAWLNEVFAEYPDRIGILAIHDYLRSYGDLSSYGKRVFDAVVVPSHNLRFVLCGHNSGTAYRVDVLDDDGDGTPDRSVHQMMLNYQDDDKRTGYLRILTFRPDRSLVVDTYSPYMDDHDYFETLSEYGEESFTIENAF